MNRIQKFIRDADVPIDSLPKGYSQRISKHCKNCGISIVRYSASKNAMCAPCKKLRYNKTSPKEDVSSLINRRTEEFEREV